MNILKLGSQGDSVKILQLDLKKLGYPLTGTGYFGNQTDVAIEAFQRAYNLTVDGEVGPETLKALEDAVKARNHNLDIKPSVANKRPLWLQEALSHVGLTEAPGNKNNPEIVNMGKEVDKDYTADSIPWCVMFVSYCLAKSGVKASKQPLWALSYAGNWGIKLTGPALGAIAVKTRKGGGHVTFIAGRTPTGYLACCGGNQNDQVNITSYQTNAFNEGFFWPKDIALPEKIGINTLPLVNSSGKIVFES